MSANVENLQTLLIDIDDTIVDSFELPIVNRFLGTNYVESDFKDYIQEIFIDDAERERFNYFLFSQTLYDDSVGIKDNAISVLKELNANYNLFLCSDYTSWEYPWQSHYLFLQKFEMLKRHFSFISPAQHIFIKNKKLLAADIIIDDRDYNFGQYVKNRLLFDAYHNRNISDDELGRKSIRRVNSWEEISKLLL